MTHKLNAQQYLTLLAVVLTASFGDALLSRGMTQVVDRHGAVDFHHLPLLFDALSNPNIVVGIFLLVGFFASYTTALSWADLTFVMPATAFGNVVIALLSRYMLHEHLSLSRWLGILLLTSAVGLVANRPARTDLKSAAQPETAFESCPTPESCPAPGPRLDAEPTPTKLPATRSGVGI